MLYKIWPMSPLAQADYPEIDVSGLPLIDKPNPHTNEQKYPFKSLNVGQSFVVDFSAEEKSAVANRVRVAANKAAKRIGSTLRVYVHLDHNCIEVVRVA